MDIQHLIHGQVGLGGSFFNNFTPETHVSEILRFIAGAMSHSLDVSDGSTKYKVLEQCKYITY